MVVNADRTSEAAADGIADETDGAADRTADGAAGGSPRGPLGRPVSGTRRQLIRGLLAPAVAVSLAPLVAASRPSQAAPGTPTRHPHPEPHAEAGAEPRPGDPADGASFDETYRGRRIRGIRSAAGRAVGAGTWHVTVDGRPLHLMRRADGSWLSMVDHYRSYPTPLAAARGAVDELGPGEQLRDTPAAAGQDHSGRHRGVHA
ncbi:MULTISPECIES: tyrosinase family oxidase copper chaperone [Streptomyces rochei group]|uniref:Tyrosinase family oxidase copper chaperone n=1 Tax=Streptomyces plicatus TaxID=1922 RepID=A0ABW1XWP4_STRPL|nr:tyrosinase family oxidase copper chaperone [Streptomyces plicatus]GGZ42702.1 tyrosinase [Streptomyces plicatus]